MGLNNLRKLRERRIELRKRLKPAEAALWNHLKRSQLSGFKFRRQHSIGHYILDFYCPSAKLGVELDGAVHESAEAQAYDTERDAFLASVGVKVLRFSNDEVLENMSGVVARIRAVLGE